MPVVQSSENSLFVTITHKTSGAHATVSLTGATVTSYVDSASHEMIFVSRLAKLDGSKAIRGGIPLVFPQFGQPDPDMPQHGFLRANKWKLGESEENDDYCACDFELLMTDNMRDRGSGKWAPNGELDCSVVLTVKVTSMSLTTILTIKNTGNVPIENPQALFHTYYKIEDGKATNKETCSVFGLKGYNVLDKVPAQDGDKTFVQEEDYVTISRETDLIYSNPLKTDLEVEISTGSHSRVFLKATGTLNEKKQPISVVVWNPFIEKAKALGDFGDDQYHDMICVEPGLLNESGIPLNADENLVFSQTLESMIRSVC